MNNGWAAMHQIPSPVPQHFFTRCTTACGLLQRCNPGTASRLSASAGVLMSDVICNDGSSFTRFPSSGVLMSDVICNNGSRFTRFQAPLCFPGCVPGHSRLWRARSSAGVRTLIKRLSASCFSYEHYGWFPLQSVSCVAHPSSAPRHASAPTLRRRS